MALNDVQLVQLRQLFKHYERTIKAMVDDGARSIRHQNNTQLFHEAGRIIEKLKGYRRKFQQTERAIHNAAHVRPRQQIGAFGPQQARSRMVQLKQTERERDATLKRVLTLVGGGALAADFQHKGIIDIANKIEKQFTEIGEAYNPHLDDGPVFLPGHQPAGGGWVAVLHVMLLIMELIRARQAGK
jgi:hypothetical protein